VLEHRRRLLGLPDAEERDGVVRIARDETLVRQGLAREIAAERRVGRHGLRPPPLERHRALTRHQERQRQEEESDTREV
jgi:hypothetical protein